MAVHLPESVLSTEDLERRLAARNPQTKIPYGMITRLSGVRYRHIADPGCDSVELGVRAARKLFDESGRDIADVDLILFAAVSLPMVEPATSHAVAAALGARCPVFDVRNACNSVVNAMEVADSLIRTESYRTVLIVCGERITNLMKWTVGDLGEYLANGAAYTASDAGAALLIEASDEPGILGVGFSAESQSWDAAVVPIEVAAGSQTLRTGAFSVDGLRFARAFVESDLGVIPKKLAELGLSMSDLSVVCVHQPVEVLTRVLCERLDLREEQMVKVIGEHGNMAAASLPVQLALAIEAGRVRRGDLVAFLGLASGMSYGVVVMKW